MGAEGQAGGASGEAAGPSASGEPRWPPGWRGRCQQAGAGQTVCASLAAACPPSPTSSASPHRLSHVVSFAGSTLLGGRGGLPQAGRRPGWPEDACHRDGPLARLPAGGGPSRTRFFRGPGADRGRCRWSLTPVPTCAGLDSRRPVQALPCPAGRSGAPPPAFPPRLPRRSPRPAERVRLPEFPHLPRPGEAEVSRCLWTCH